MYKVRYILRATIYSFILTAFGDDVVIDFLSSPIFFIRRRENNDINREKWAPVWNAIRHSDKRLDKCLATEIGWLFWSADEIDLFIRQQIKVGKSSQ